MKKRLILIVIGTILLVGCSDNKVKPDETTQAITMENEISNQEIISTDTITTESTTASQDNSEQTTWENYYKTKAEEKAIELETEQLESEFHAGKIENDVFIKEKADKKAQEDALEAEEDQLTRALFGKMPAITVSTEGKSKEELLQLKQENEKQKDSLDVEENQLEKDYQQNPSDKMGFIEKQIEIERRDSILDAEEDLIEKALKELGWDD